ncbi:MBL fold metallo-hydrolase [Methanosarcinales archaeon]|nr:MAG: MBL fold metallo-hydrolase [Methanosarcinales archaeon]
MKLHFLGAAKEVTGSCIVIETRRSKFLLDCGQRQGHEKESRPGFPFNPREIDFVVLSHAHLDHSGLLPKLVAEGFDGEIYSTVATRDVAELLLKDSAKIQKEADESGAGVMPMFTEEDVVQTIDKFSVSEWNVPVNASEDISVTFLDAGHILGASISVVDISGAGRLVYTGDIGHGRSPIMNAPAKLNNTDFLIIESTYGAKRHPAVNPKESLKQIILDTHANKGKVLIPTFAVGRSQEILYTLKQLYEEKKLPNIPVYFDTPLGAETTSLYRHHQNYLRAEFRSSFLRGENPFHFGRLDFIRGNNRSLDVASSGEPCVVIAASGMLTGGRILNHLKTTLEDPDSSLVFVGYQAEGTPGREILDGKKRVEIAGKEYRVMLKVYYIPGLSAHADADGLFSFINSAELLPKKIFVVHGEPENAEALQRRIINNLRIDTFVPEMGYTENFMDREVVKVVEKDVHLDFRPQYTRIGEYEVYPFAGALLKKQDGIHLISKEQYIGILTETEEELETMLAKVTSKKELETEAAAPAEEISEVVFKEELLKYADAGIFSRSRARELKDKIEEEGRDATIAHINKLARKDRLYPLDKAKQEVLRKVLVAGINSFPQKARKLFEDISEK